MEQSNLEQMIDDGLQKSGETKGLWSLGGLNADPAMKEVVVEGICYIRLVASV